MKKASQVFAGGVTVSFVGILLMGIGDYLTRRVLARGLEKSEYGFFFSAFAMACLFVMVAGGGLSYATQILVAKYRSLNEARRAKAAFGHALVMSLGYSGVSLLCVDDSDAVSPGPFL